jgi:hypothetical protein
MRIGGTGNIIEFGLNAARAGPIGGVFTYWCNCTTFCTQRPNQVSTVYPGQADDWSLPTVDGREWLVDDLPDHQLGRRSPFMAQERAI